MTREAEYKPLKRLIKKTTIENLWLYLLTELKKGDQHPYALIKIIQEKYSFNPGKVLPYVVLKKLERENFVKSYNKDNRHYYKITNRGIQLLDEGASFLRNILKMITEN